jgi:hypothetical protein
MNSKTLAQVSLADRSDFARISTSSDRRMRRDKRKQSAEFRIILLATFTVFFVAGIAERLLPWKSPSARQSSVFQQARESANRCTTYAFMG